MSVICRLACHSVNRSAIPGLCSGISGVDFNIKICRLVTKFNSRNSDIVRREPINIQENFWPYCPSCPLLFRGFCFEELTWLLVDFQWLILRTFEIGLKFQNIIIAIELIICRKHGVNVKLSPPFALNVELDEDKWVGRGRMHYHHYHDNKWAWF